MLRNRKKQARRPTTRGVTLSKLKLSKIEWFIEVSPHETCEVTPRSETASTAHNAAALLFALYRMTVFPGANR